MICITKFWANYLNMKRIRLYIQCWFKILNTQHFMLTRQSNLFVYFLMTLKRAKKYFGIMVLCSLHYMLINWWRILTVTYNARLKVALHVRNITFITQFTLEQINNWVTILNLCSRRLRSCSSLRLINTDWMVFFTLLLRSLSCYLTDTAAPWSL